MNNSEKAKEIAVKWKAKGLPYNAIYDSCLEMAKWKDSQFAEEKEELLILVEILPIDERNQTIIEDLKGLLQ